MLDTFRKRDNLRTPTPHQPGSRPLANSHTSSPAAGGARADAPGTKPVLLDSPATTPAVPAPPAPAMSSTPPVPAAAQPAVLDALQETTASSARLIVGPGIKLKGADITDCDTIIVEGEVDASMESRVVEISEQGVFRGKVDVEVAEIRGRFEGELTAQKRLVIHHTGRASGKIRYGKICIDEGGELSGDIAAAEAGADGQRGNRALDLRARDSGAASPTPAAASTK
jgi:cytoskeletal protein CcmA (bactofilin family)